MTYSMTLNGGKLIENGVGVHYPEGFTVNVIADGTGFGNPEPLTRTMNTLMTQGSWETLGGPGNRTPALVIEVEGDTPDGLNAGEVWLSALMGSGALEWLPPDQTVTTVFDVVWSYIDRTMDERWDLDDAQWIRFYRIPIKALPSARSAELTVTPAAPVGAVVDVQINDGTSLTGWSAFGSKTYPASSPVAMTPTVVSGAVRVTRPSLIDTYSNLSLRYDLTSPIPSATPYLRVDSRYSRGSRRNEMVTNLGSIDLAYATYAFSSGVVTQTAYFPVTDAVEWVQFTTVTNYSTSAYLEVDQLRRVSRLPEDVTLRQKTAAIYPGGSAPAEGNLHVSAATALGQVLVYTYPLGRPSPALMQYRTSSSSPFTGAAMINGRSIPISEALPLVITVPDRQIPCRGLSALWAKFRVDFNPVTVTWTATPWSGSSVVGPTISGSVTLGTGLVQLVPLGLLTLPSAVTGPEGAMVITLQRTSGTGDVFVDESWAFGQDDETALTIVDAGTGTPAAGGPSTDVWINAPSAEKPAGEVLIGTGPGNARWPSTELSRQVHKFPCKGVTVLAITTSAQNADTDLTHYRRWTHHAGS